jgi:viologen exporter family transport system permease protein
MVTTMSNGVLPRFGSTAAFVAALARSQLRASFARRGAFFASAGLMLLNDLLFFTIWWVLMHRFGQVGGWHLQDVMMLYAVATVGYGTCVIVFGGLQDLSRKIAEGELDPFLTQPKLPLYQALASRSQASGWGDIAAGSAFFALSGVLGPSRLPWLLLAVPCSAVAFTASGVVFHSLAFWLGRIQSLSRSLFEFTVSFSLYPPALFEGTVRILLFTVLPAGFTAYLPVELLRQPSVSTALLAVGGTASYAAFALWLFQRGLRSYCSGSRITTGAGA